MGEVFRATDQRLGRQVAIKVLRSGSSDDPFARTRLLREARAIAALNHPRICTLYDIGHADGVDYLVMELMEGVTLDERLQHSTLGIDECMRIGAEIAEGLHAAHQRGLIHRDLKPSNVMLTQHGVKILDFGIARQTVLLVESPDLPTDNGTVGGSALVGTIPYMSPEQFAGLTLDSRSDLFSLGVVLYESLAGVRPFSASSQQATIQAIVRCRPVPLTKLRPDVPPGLGRAVMKCLHREPRKRWSNAADLAEHLGALMAAQSIQASPGRRRPSTTVQAAPTVRCLAVMPFDTRSVSPEQEFLGEALAEHVASTISRTTDLLVMGLSSTRLLAAANRTPGEIGSALRVQMILAGKITRSRWRVGASVMLIDALTGGTLWSGRYERPFAQVEDAQSGLADAIAAELGVRLSASRRGVSTTVKPEAQEAYLRGRYHMGRLTESSLRIAREYVTSAVRKAPGYASAHVSLAEWYMLAASRRLASEVDVLPKARAAALDALRIDPGSSGAYSVLGHIALRECDLAHARDMCGTALSLDPNDASSHVVLSYCYRAVEDYDEAFKHARSAERIDPLSLRTKNLWIGLLLCAGQYDECIERCRLALQGLPIEDQGRLLYFSGLARGFAGDDDGAIDELTRAAAVVRHPAALVGLAVVLTRRRPGVDAAAPFIEELEERAKKAEAGPYDFAELYAGLGDEARAIAFLRRAMALRVPELSNLRCEPMFRTLKSNSEFHEMLQELGLEDTTLTAPGNV